MENGEYSDAPPLNILNSSFSTHKFKISAACAISYTLFSSTRNAIAMFGKMTAGDCDAAVQA